MTSNFRVYWKDEYPKKKREFHKGEFESRQKARQWCKNHSWLVNLTIVHPDGTEETFKMEREYV